MTNQQNTFFLSQEENETDKVTATHWVIAVNKANLTIVPLADEENALEVQESFKRTKGHLYEVVLLTDDVSVMKFFCRQYNHNYRTYLTF